MMLPSRTQLLRMLQTDLEQSTRTSQVSPAQLAARGCTLAEFVLAAWNIIEPSTPLVWNWHLTAMCDHMQALLEGRLAKRNLLILVPPGFAKSTIVSVCAPAWRWINKPSWRAIFASGNPTVSVRDSMRCRDLIDSRWYRQTFGVDWTFASDQNQKTLYKNSASGFRMAVSSGSRITGDRSDAIFVDDPLDAADAYSKTARDSINTWFDQAFANRLNDLRTGTRCIVQQRLHEEDLAGHVMNVERTNWEVLCIPQEFEESRRFTTSLGWTDPRLNDGELAFPERFPSDIIEIERTRLGSSAYAGQHQQRPSSAEGEVFKRGYLQILEPGTPLPRLSRAIQSWDTAFKTAETSDYSVGFELGQFDRGVLILDRVRDRMAYPTLKARASAWGALRRPAAVLIEDKASGQSLIQDLKLTTNLPIVAVTVDGDKLMRAHTIVPTWESCRIFVYADAPWLQEFLDELHAFPKAAHDDQVDAFVQGVRYLTQGGGGTGLLEYYRLLAEANKRGEVAA